MSNVLVAAASRFEMVPAEFERTLKATVVPGNITNEQFTAFLMVANEYGLNPLLKEIYAFPSQRGGIQPIVSIDGWIKIINRHEQFDGLEFVDTTNEKGELVAVTAKIYRKDRRHPVVVTEYMAECRGNTDPWRKFPARMLRHKATIQCARYAFGFSGIVDEDEYQRTEKAVSGSDCASAASLIETLEQAAKQGIEAYKTAFQSLTAQQRTDIGVAEHNRLKTLAAAIDETKNAEVVEHEVSNS